MLYKRNAKGDISWFCSSGTAGEILATLQSFDHQHVKHEGALRSAFQTRLADTAQRHNWTLVPELATKAGGKRAVPDCTLTA
jgi:hypothetical protein